MINTGFEEDYYEEETIAEGPKTTVRLVTAFYDYTQYACKSVEISKIQNDVLGITSLAWEIEIMRQADHPNLVKLRQVYCDHTHIHLILDWFPDGDLR